MRRLFALGVALAAASLCTAADGGRQTTIPELIRQLSSNDFHARQLAARQLGNLGVAARDAVPALAKTLRDPLPEVRTAAGKALGQIGKPAVSVLVDALKHRDANVRTRASQSLAQAGPDDADAVPALVAALKDRNADVRVAVVDALGEMGAEGKEAAPHLARLFHDPSLRVREHVRLALAAIGPAAVEPLCDALGEDKPEVRLDAIKTIALFGPAAKKAIPTLRQAIKDDNYRIRAATANALGKMELDGGDAVPELLAALRDKKLEVQREVVTALVLLTSAGVPDLLQKVREADRKGRWVVPVALAQIAAKPKNDLAALVKDLRDKDPQVRTRAAFVLTELGLKAQPAVPALLKLLEDEDPMIRLTAAVVIARMERLKAERARVAQKIIDEARRPLRLQLPKALQALQMRAALTDPAVQSHFRQIVMLYITAYMVTFTTPQHSLLESLGPEAIPALVDGINFVAAERIGFC